MFTGTEDNWQSRYPKNNKGYIKMTEIYFVFRISRSLFYFSLVLEPGPHSYFVLVMLYHGLKMQHLVRQ